MRGRDDAAVPRQLLVKWQPACFDRVNVGEAVQIDERGAGASLQNVHAAPADFDDALAQDRASADGSKLTPGNSLAKYFSDTSRKAGATRSAKSFMLFRVR